ncbi:hypothetical protein ABPG77_008704 [Micractinium sp. CCAP 211/92]
MTESQWTEEHTQAVRAHLPGLDPPSLVHLNNAGCSLPSRNTLSAVQGYLEREATRGGYETASAAEAELRRPYTALAALLNCQEDEVAIVSSATAAWQQVVYGLAWTWRPGDRVLASVAEYGSNMIALLQLAMRTGVVIDVIPETDEGDIDLQALHDRLQPAGSTGRAPVLVTISHVPTSSGRVYDAAGVGALCRAAGVPYMLDACQSVGQMPIDVRAIGCDFLSATGRKYLRAPRGTGLLFCRRDAMSSFEPGTLDNIGATWTGSSDYALQPTAQRFEQYEINFAAKVGLGVAAEECVRLGITQIWTRIQQLAAQLRAGLAALPGVTVHDRGAVLCGLVSFTVAGQSASQVQAALQEQHINVSVSEIGSTRFDFERRGLTEVLRASVHCYNTEGELQRFLAALGQLSSVQG